jgi:hypothetical protein
LGIDGQMIGSRKTVPLRMLRIVPFGDRHWSEGRGGSVSKGRDGSVVPRKSLDGPSA